jgi:hypothetical protein
VKINHPESEAMLDSCVVPVDSEKPAAKTLSLAEKDQSVEAGLIEAARIAAATGEPMRSAATDEKTEECLRANGFLTNKHGEFFPKDYAGFNVWGRTRSSDVWQEMDKIRNAGGSARRGATLFTFIAPDLYGRPGPVENWLEDLMLRNLALSIRIPGSRRIFAATRCSALSQAFQGLSAGDDHARPQALELETIFAKALEDGEFKAALRRLRRGGEHSSADNKTLELREIILAGDASISRVSSQADRDAAVGSPDAGSPDAGSPDAKLPDAEMAHGPIHAAPLGDFFLDVEKGVLLRLACGPLSTAELREALMEAGIKASNEDAPAGVGVSSKLLPSLSRAGLIFQQRDALPRRKFRWALTPRGRYAALFI